MLFCACVFLSWTFSFTWYLCVAYHTYIHTPYIFHLNLHLRNGGLLFQFWSIGINLKEVRQIGWRGRTFQSEHGQFDT